MDLALILARKALGAIVALIFLASCAGSQAPIGTPDAVSPSTAHRAAQPFSSGNIYWNKQSLRLPYPSMSPKKALLTYWAPNGYYTEPVYCRNGGKISATAHRKYGNPSGYMHVVFWFKALTAGPDECAFTAVLKNTGSPPIAVIQLHIDR